jgi:hypothetical protein
VKKSEVTYLMLVLLVLAPLKLWALIDGMAFILLLMAYGLIRALIYSHNKINALKRIIKENNHTIELMNNHISVLKNRN